MDSPVSCAVAFSARWCSGGGWQEPGRGVAFTMLWWRLLGASVSPRRQQNLGERFDDFSFYFSLFKKVF